MTAPAPERDFWRSETQRETEKSQGLQRDVEALRARYHEERDIVTRIWRMLGSHSYEELAGRSIYDLVAELQALATMALTPPAASEEDAK